MRRVIVFTVGINVLMFSYMINAYVKYKTSSDKIEQKHAIFKTLKQNHEYILHTQHDWQKCAQVDLKLVFAWFYEHNIKLKLINETQSTHYITYNIQLSFSSKEEGLHVLKNLPFGKLLINTVESNKDGILVTAALSFSNILPKQNIKTISKTEDIHFKLNGIIKTQNNWQICLNDTWFNDTDEVPIKIIEVGNNYIKFTWTSFGKSENYTINLYESVTLKQKYDF